jgi:hypothetical protein
MQAIANGTPDLEVLDDTALITHLYALLQALRSEERVEQMQQAFPHLRVQDDQGRALIQELCRQLHAILLQESANMGMLAKVINSFDSFYKTIPKSDSVAVTLG